MQRDLSKHLQLAVGCPVSGILAAVCRTAWTAVRGPGQSGERAGRAAGTGERAGRAAGKRAVREASWPGLVCASGLVNTFTVFTVCCVVVCELSGYSRGTHYSRGRLGQVGVLSSNSRGSRTGRDPVL